MHEAGTMLGDLLLQMAHDAAQLGSLPAQSVHDVRLGHRSSPSWNITADDGSQPTDERRAFASSDRHMVEDVGENPHVEQCVSHGMSDGVFAGDDADGVERHALECCAVARAVVAPHEGCVFVHGHVENPMQVVLNSPMTARQDEQALRWLCYRILAQRC